ncbi:MAG: SagB/ThcOx family dehydrogenase [Gammaproteobacteria bacterium]
MNVFQRTHFITGDVESGIDSKVYESILKTHAKEAITLLDIGLVSVTNTENEMIERVQFTECDILPFHQGDLECTAEGAADFERLASVNAFEPRSISFSDVSKFLIHAFSPDKTGRRPYPSAGGLYPVEPLVFLFNERLEEDVESGCYHFRPIKQKLQIIQSITYEHFFNKLLHGMIKIENAPCFCILYVAHLGKSIFKYRYRGYRHAVMECGAMYQQATLVSQRQGLRTTAWSSFGDHEMLQALNLDPGVFLPITMQLFGYKDI